MYRALWDKSTAFHGHECPGLMIGVRACEAAIDFFGIAFSEDEELVCVTETDACSVDAIQALLGCTLGKGNLIYRGTGKHAFSFFDRRTGQALRVYYKAQNPGLDREAWQERLFGMPLNDVFDFTTPTCEPPEIARLFVSITCERCHENAPEHKIRLQDGKRVCLDCFNAYDRGW